MSTFNGWITTTFYRGWTTSPASRATCGPRTPARSLSTVLCRSEAGRTTTRPAGITSAYPRRSTRVPRVRAPALVLVRNSRLLTRAPAWVENQLSPREPARRRQPGGLRRLQMLVRRQTGVAGRIQSDRVHRLDDHRAADQPRRLVQSRQERERALDPERPPTMFWDVTSRADDRTHVAGQSVIGDAY
jgi:hypothetical protein